MTVFKSAVLVNLTQKKRYLKRCCIAGCRARDNFFYYYIENGYNLSLGFKPILINSIKNIQRNKHFRF
jgi:NTE family protein